MTNALQNASLNGCGYIVMPTMSLVAYLNRSDWAKIADDSLVNGPRCVLQLLLRLVVFGLPAGICALPAVFFKKDWFGGD